MPIFTLLATALLADTIFAGSVFTTEVVASALALTPSIGVAFVDVMSGS